MIRLNHYHVRYLYLSDSNKSRILIVIVILKYALNNGEIPSPVYVDFINYLVVMHSLI